MSMDMEWPDPSFRKSEIATPAFPMKMHLIESPVFPKGETSAMLSEQSVGADLLCTLESQSQLNKVAKDAYGRLIFSGGTPLEWIDFSNLRLMNLPYCSGFGGERKRVRLPF